MRGGAGNERGGGPEDEASEEQVEEVKPRSRTHHTRSHKKIRSGETQRGTQGCSDILTSMTVKESQRETNTGTSSEKGNRTRRYFSWQDELGGRPAFSKNTPLCGAKKKRVASAVDPPKKKKKEESIRPARRGG